MPTKIVPGDCMHVLAEKVKWAIKSLRDPYSIHRHEHKLETGIN